MTKKNLINKAKIKSDKTNNQGNLRMSRKKFIASIFVAGTAVSMPLSISYGSNILSNDILTQNQISIVKSVQNILYPSDGNGPGAYDVMAEKYLLWVLSDVRMDPEERDYAITGIGWVDETANETYNTNYNKLSESQKIDLIAIIAKESWGNSWLGVMLSYIFEALLSDPQYGGNPYEIGWDWVDHYPGYPRPTKALLYPNIFKTVSTNTQQ